MLAQKDSKIHIQDLKKISDHANHSAHYLYLTTVNCRTAEGSKKYRYHHLISI